LHFAHSVQVTLIAVMSYSCMAYELGKLRFYAPVLVTSHILTLQHHMWSYSSHSHTSAPYAIKVNLTLADKSLTV